MLLQGPEAAAIAVDRNKEVILKSSPPFTDCIIEINNTQVDSDKDFDVVVPVYDLTDHSNSH